MRFAVDQKNVTANGLHMHMFVWCTMFSCVAWRGCTWLHMRLCVSWYVWCGRIYVLFHCTCIYVCHVMHDICVYMFFSIVHAFIRLCTMNVYVCSFSLHTRSSRAACKIEHNGICQSVHAFICCCMYDVCPFVYRYGLWIDRGNRRTNLLHAMCE